jgi:uncharacterized protein (DUF4415 family)
MKMAISPDSPSSGSAKPADDEMRAEYIFRELKGVVRGKYAARYGERLRIVRLAKDVAEAFADETAVNDALREYLKQRQSA